MSPGFVVADFERVDQGKFRWIRFEEKQYAALVESEDAVSLGNHAAILAERSTRPGLLACLHIDAGEPLVLRLKIDVIIDQNR